MASPLLAETLEKYLAVPGNAANAVRALINIARQYWIDSRTEESLPILDRAIQIAKTPDFPSVGWTEDGQGGRGVPFWVNPQQYMLNSPIYAVDQIQTPLLILQGDLDGAVDMQQAIRFYNALKRVGDETAFVRYWGEDHSLSSEWAIRDSWNRILLWFNSHLKGD